MPRRKKESDQACITMYTPPQPEGERPLPDWDWIPYLDPDSTDRSLDELPFDDAHKAIILEYAASVLYRSLAEAGIESGHKSYDPLTIEGSVAWSYVFELTTDGRRHPFTSLAELEQALIKAGARNIRRFLGEQVDE